MKREQTIGQSKARSNVENSHILLRQYNMHFQEADANSDGELDFDEFEAALPKTVREKHSRKEIRRWFQMIDDDGNGKVSLDEHFAWALNAAALSSGAGVKKIFAKYDRDGSGELSEIEFCCAATELGLGDTGEALFRALPGSENGYVNYLNLVEQAQVGANTPILSMRTCVHALGWGWDEGALCLPGRRPRSHFATRTCPPLHLLRMLYACSLHVAGVPARYARRLRRRPTRCR